MKAVICRNYGSPDLLTLEDMPSLTPEPNEVIVDVKACGLNFPDTLIIQGKYQFQPEFPFSPGGEVAGTVKSIGSEVKHLCVGDRVMAGTSWGGMAQEARSLASNAFKIPDSMSFESAAGSLMTYATAYHALVDRAAIKSGETVLVLGAAGGIGVASIQIAKILGCHVIACASTDDKLDFCSQLGADETVNYMSEDLKTRVKEITNGQGADVIVDPVGGRFAEPAFRSIARFGRYLVVGFASGEIPSIAWNLPLLKSASIVGVFWGSFFRNNPEDNAQNVAQLLRWFDDGQMSTQLYQVYPLSAFKEALDCLTNKEVKGKIVLLP
ncbi:NADPH:quinone oxidoreductase family protein [Reichenbachiella agarivorans]|uniref:NADPH:quinone oxidoreductase family protein n=1 Tax=Reichenbachiella agarivorans TaxID=2979464 RepID=A0ABY6CNT5_9BACT|nr:NADPH:quinone oxidoreductase family protein [Reichenbachiella agarivorans]UXP32192.1 NADPH:quinone oxidoreductase family protein [Reichenbachiella agarivorans]